MTLNNANVRSKVPLLAGGIYKTNVINDEEYRRLRDQITEDAWEYFTYDDKNVKFEIQDVTNIKK